MSNLLTNPGAIVNAALDRVGYKKRIGSLYDGSEASVKALDIYGQARDEMLRSFDWGFAERDVTLTLLKTAPVGGYTPLAPWTTANPIPPWTYEYTYPGDCLKVRSLRYVGLIPEYDPQAIEFRIANDNSYTPARRVILTNLAQATLVYTSQITDPLTWDVGFTEFFITALGQRLAPALADMDVAKLEAQEEAQTITKAEMTIG